ncbi:hypothetical protein QEN19_001272 [Hanseniaspora menglaensis]
MMNSFKNKYFYWKGPDVLSNLVLLVLNIIVYRLKPFERQFYINDLSISHPFTKKQKVSDMQLLIYSAIIPFCIIILYCIAFRFKRNTNNYYLLWVSVVGLALTLNVTALITNYLKNWFGRPRPDFLSRCSPKSGTPSNVLVFAKDVCTTHDIEKLYEGFRSCPSGHSSESFAGLGFLYYFLSGQLHVDFPNNNVYRKLICFIPLLGATLIALSRTQDYRHHFTDIFLGSFMGFIISREIYKHYFSLNSESVYSNTPYGSEAQTALKSEQTEYTSYKLLDTDNSINTEGHDNSNTNIHEEVQNNGALGSRLV